MGSMGFKVFAPASIGNLSIGFDILGLAINGAGDEIIFKEGNKPGVNISSVHGDGRKLPRDPLLNTASFAAIKLAEAAGIADYSVDLEIFKNMPIGSGMGSSAASAAAGAFGMNLYLGEPFDKKELVNFATQAETIADGSFHADNTGPSMLGGLILIRDHESLDLLRLPSPTGIQIVMIKPNISILTKTARDMLSNTIALEQHIKQSGNLAAFVSSLYSLDFDMMKKSMNDIIIEPQRKTLIPHFDSIKEVALNEGCISFGISGAGPSMFAICENSFQAEKIATKATEIYANKNLECTTLCTSINNEGAKKM